MTVNRKEYKITVGRTGVEKRQEWESHRMALDRMKEYKEQQRQQQIQEEWDTAYAQMLQEFEQT